MDLITVMRMTDEEVWLSQFDDRDLEASHILLQLPTRPMPLPTPEPRKRIPRPRKKIPEPRKRMAEPRKRMAEPRKRMPEPEPFLVVWGRKKLLRGVTRRPSGGPSFPSSRVQSASPTSTLTTDQPSYESDDSATHQPANKRRKLVAQSAEQMKKKSKNEMESWYDLGVTIVQLYLQKQGSSLYPDGPKSMGLLRIQPKQEVAQSRSLERQARAREARRLRKMKIRQRRQTLH